MTYARCMQGCGGLGRAVAGGRRQSSCTCTVLPLIQVIECDGETYILDAAEEAGE